MIPDNHTSQPSTKVLFRSYQEISYLNHNCSVAILLWQAIEVGMSNRCTDFLLEEFAVAPKVIPIHKSKSLYDPHKMITVDNSENGKDSVSYQFKVSGQVLGQNARVQANFM